MEITMRQVIISLKMMHQRYYKGNKFKAVDFEQMTVTNKDKILSVTGMGAPRPEFEDGGEALAGLVEANQLGITGPNDIAVIKSTAHALKFAGFQEMYFEQQFPPEFNIKPDSDLINVPVYVQPKDFERLPEPGKPLSGDDFKVFVRRMSDEIAGLLDLKKR